MRALPFGARNAVFVFGSIARALELILLRLFDIVNGQYVDDYICFELAGLVDQEEDTMVQVLELLGWQVKKVEGMVPEFADIFHLLGVRFDLRRAEVGELVIDNKPERAQKICQDIERILEAGRVSPQEVEVLRGSLNFTRAQCFGRCGGAALNFLSTVVRAGGVQLDEVARLHLAYWPRFFAVAKPRIIRFADRRPPIILHTDGAEEPDGVGVGAVIEDRWTGLKEYWGGMIRSSLVDEWKKKSGKTRVIHQAETYPALLAIKIWRKELHGRRVILFVDNDAAKEAIVKGVSGSVPSAEIVTALWEEAAANSMYLWVDRVPSAANVADGPSRGDNEDLEKEGFAKVLVRVPELREI